MKNLGGNLGLSLNVSCCVVEVPWVDAMEILICTKKGQGVEARLGTVDLASSFLAVLAHFLSPQNLENSFQTAPA